MDHNYGAKYFIDPSHFVLDPTLNKQRLKSQYIRDISNLFKPYIESNQEEEQHVYAGTNSVKNSQSLDKKQPSGKNKNAAISPPTYNDEPSKDQVSTKTKEQLQKYYQQMNASMDVQNEKILQQFMDVLDDQEEQQHKPKQSNPQKKIPLAYQYGGEKKQRDNKETVPQYEPSTNSPSKQGNQNVFQKNQNIFQKNQNSLDKNQNRFQKSNQNNFEKNQNNFQKNSGHFEHPQAPKQKQASGMMAPPKIAKNSQLQNEQTDYQQQVVWRDGDDLQNRIKRAIENSKTIIKRFKSVKQNQ